MIPYIQVVMIIGCYLAIIALYVWVFKTTQELRDMFHKHNNESEKHTLSTDLVFKDVCELQVKRFEEKIDSVKASLHTGFDEVKALIKEIKQ